MSYLDAYDRSLHGRLMARLSEQELEHRWEIAKGRHSNQFWTQEWLDLAFRRGRRRAAELKWE